MNRSWVNGPRAVVCTGELEGGESWGDGVWMGTGSTLGSTMYGWDPSRTATLTVGHGREMLSNSQSMAESTDVVKRSGGFSEATELDGGANFGGCG